MSAHRALARKYRSRHFGELIGQPVLVQTLTNAIENGRLHHAYMFTGIRGTGKTSTARILAKAINYVGPNGDGKPTVGPTDDCPICQAIGEDRHPDIVEIDAASNTGVDDVRQIIDNVRYAPVQARYKVFIIDEVHMLSKQAFNALLKTLEEPPPHVIFMMATTEIRKVPTTILSRCQRFDLRRIDVPTLVEHFRKIATAENVTVDDEALYLIAQAADGSARDGLSIFDQAIAQSNNEPITAEKLRGMLGQANSGNVLDIFAELMNGNLEAVLKKLAALYEMGTDPATFLDDLLNVTHLVTRVKVTPEVAKDKTLGAHVSEQAEKMAGEFSLSSLSRVWQMLLKAVPEVAQAPQPQQALEMALVRVGFAASLPPLEDILKKAPQPDTAASPSASSTPVSSAPAAPVAQRISVVASSGAAVRSVAAPQPQAMQMSETQQELQSNVATGSITDFESLVALCEDRDPMLGADLYANVRLVKFAQGQLQIEILKGAAKDLVNVLPRKLQEWTGERWLVSPVTGGGQQTLSERADGARKDAIEKAYADPAIAAIKSIIPNIKITEIQTEN